MNQITTTPKQTIPALIPSNFEELRKVGETVVKSGFAPKGMESPEACIIAMQAGMEVGLPPIASLQNYAVINGRPALYGDALLAIVRSSGLLEDITDKTITGNTEDDAGIAVTVKRYGQTAITREFTVKDAKRAGLWGKKGPWSEYPKRMLYLRARTFALRDGFSDVLRGIACVEEVQDTMRDAKVRVVEYKAPAAEDPMLTLDNTPPTLNERIKTKAIEAKLPVEAMIVDAAEAGKISKEAPLEDLSDADKEALLAL